MKIEYETSGNVISLAPARTQRKFPAISQIDAYWHGVRNGRLMPTRADIDPRGISKILSNAFILESIAPGLAKIRLAGEVMREILDMEVRGMPFSSYFLPESRHTLQDLLQDILETPATATLELSGDSGLTRPALSAQLYLAPLRDEYGAATRILGAIELEGRIGRAPRRFRIRETSMRPLTTAAPFPPHLSGAPRQTQNKTQNKIPGQMRGTEQSANVGSSAQHGRPPQGQRDSSAGQTSGKPAIRALKSFAQKPLGGKNPLGKSSPSSLASSSASSSKSKAPVLHLVRPQGQDPHDR